MTFVLREEKNIDGEEFIAWIKRNMVPDSEENSLFEIMKVK